jgi:glutaredoxin 2
MEARLSNLGKAIHNMAMPYWIYTKEFDEASRAYFQNKKEKKRGPFANLIKNRDKFLAELEPLLQELESELGEEDFYQSDSLRIHDILIASHLWGMYVVPEFQFSETLHKYLQRVRKKCRFNYMDELWT